MTTIYASSQIEIIQSGPNILYAADGDSANIISAWPVTLFNEDPSGTLRVLFTTDITLTGNTQYFICESTNIQFGSRSLRGDGSRPVITIDGVTDYPGLIRNGEMFSNGKSGISVCNLVVSSSGSTLAFDGGWIGQAYFGRNANNIYITNCTSDGIISQTCGGILGSNAGDMGGGLVIIHCSSTGAINLNAGGILGANAASTNGIIQCEECFSSGAIGVGAGGIAGLNAGNVTAVQCYSSGTIGDNAGGIFGSSAFKATAIGCYSEGVIGSNGGGIFGILAGKDTGATVQCSNCYSTGAIGLNAGGIYGFGYILGATSTVNCYTSGSGATGGIFSGSNSDNNLYSSNNYSEANNSGSGWNTANATAHLIMANWLDVGPNQPFLIHEFGYSLYSPDNISTGYGLNKVYEDTVNAGDSTNSAITTGYTFTQLPSSELTEPTITINGSTGQISTTTATPSGLYVFHVLAQMNPYHHILVRLTVNGPGSSCCPNLKGLPYEDRAEALVGKALLLERIQKPKMRFASHEDYIAYKKAIALTR